MEQNASTMKSVPVALEIPPQNPIGRPAVPPDFIITALPSDPLKIIFKFLPASHLFIAPVCRRFRDLYGDARKEEKKKKYATFKFSIVTEAALQIYLKEKSVYLQKWETSMIGAGCG